MLSYLHSYHAGNFADVLKHMISAHILDYLTQKPKPFFYLDTHAGEGAYALEQSEAQKNREYENGIGQLWQQTGLPPAAQTYLTLIETFNAEFPPAQQLSHYPGSPWFAQQLMTEYDRLALCELHPREFQTLSQNFKNNRRIQIHQADGFHACMSQLPPKENRGYVLMDPPYEVKQDYRTVVETLIKAHKKFATGTYALWYPVVERHRIDTLEKAFIKSGIRNIQLFELGLKADSGEKGMTASGMIVINPPWTLKAEMETALPFLAKKLGDRQGRYTIKQLVAE